MVQWFKVNFGSIVLGVHCFKGFISSRVLLIQGFYWFKRLIVVIEFNSMQWLRVQLNNWFKGSISPRVQLLQSFHWFKGSIFLSVQLV